MRKLLLLLLALGCTLPLLAQRRATLSPSSQAYAQQAQALRDLEYSIQQLAARIDAIEQQQSSLSTRIAQVERGNGMATKDDVAALRADLNAVRAKQESLRGEIVEDLSSKIAKITKQQQRAAEKPVQKSGYNHIVESGQTISAIAEAYKVSTQSIIRANKISDPTKIRVGQKLFIPDP